MPLTVNIPKAHQAEIEMTSSADKASATDQLGGAEMADSVQQQLVWNLELMPKEQLKEFQHQLPDQDLRKQSPCVTRTQPEQVKSMEVVSRLVAQNGKQQAWDLALQTWEQMGLSELCARVRKEQPWSRVGRHSALCVLSISRPQPPSPTEP